MAGLTTAGLTIKRLEEIREDLNSSARAEFGNDIRTDDLSVLGHILGIHALSLSEVWQLLQALYDSFDPDNAQGIMLDNNAGLVGITRNAATFAQGTVTITGTAGTVIPVARIVRSATTQATFLTDVEVTIPVGGSIDVTVTAEEAGALTVLAGEVTEIVTPVSGWAGVTNAADFTPGLDTESDADLRTRRQESLQIIGAGTDGAIRANIRKFDYVINAVVISNRTLVTVGGIPPKAFEAIVWPDSLTVAQQEEIAGEIFLRMPAGIEPHGDLSFTVTDDQGFDNVVEFSFATERAIVVEVTVTTDATFPANGDEQIQDALLSVADSEFDIGADVLYLSLLCAAKLQGVVTASVLVSFAPGPAVGTSNLTIANSEIATLDSSDITVNVT